MSLLQVCINLIATPNLLEATKMSAKSNHPISSVISFNLVYTKIDSSSPEFQTGVTPNSRTVFFNL